MTIVAIKEKDRVVVGLSNVGFLVDMDSDDAIDEENLPIAFTPNGKLVAMARKGRAADILLSDDDFVVEIAKATPKTIVEKFVPAIKEKLREGGSHLKEGSWVNAMLICDDEHIYGINPDFFVYEEKDYTLHGFNTSELRSVLDELADEPAETRIIEAFRFLGETLWEDCFPIVIADTKTRDYRVIRKKGAEQEDKELCELCDRIVVRARRCRKVDEVGAPEMIVRQEKKMLYESVDDLVKAYDKGGKV